ncbi:MAG: SWIM zinc finger family protein [Nitrospiria bacterium]
MSRWEWPRYVPVSERRAKAEKATSKMVKKGQKLSPVRLEGRTLARTFWGKAWCDHLESFSDFENRLPRGRSYVRNGSVIHLDIDAGKVAAFVQGSSLYKVQIDIQSVGQNKWGDILNRCSGEIDSVIELLQGKFSSAVMKTITDKQKGLFPLPKEISLNCSCPDWAKMCKHVAAVLYGVGARLDHEPQLLFKLRRVDHMELVNNTTLKTPSVRSSISHFIENQNLSELFGIEIADKTAKSKKTLGIQSKTETTKMKMSVRGSKIKNRK